MTGESGRKNALTRVGRAYLATVIAGGIAAILASVYRLHIDPLGYQWYLLAALTLVSGSATVTLPSVPASISVSETFVFASVLLFGPAAGTVMVALDGLVISFWMAKRRPEWYRALFNMGAPALSIWCAAQLLFLVAGVAPLIQAPTSVNTLLIPLLIFAIVYFGLNSWLIAIAVALETGLPPYRVWRENFLWLSLNYFCGGSVALLLVVYTRDVDLHFIGVIVPLILVLYFTYKTSMGRVEDANRHLNELNRLHLSTIETLAMAIDAKDQITHGHIRRVQALAVNLARKVGVADERLIKAIEAAALLHDMGKLAVPEYILNKPGKLTPAEFERMKLHASVGADILSAIDFPYPVVPIVRHHHENWNGTGYPSGISATDIPIGARILSVVDCFDALTSDRPYRPRLPDEDAINILLARRGSMYDPLIVDTFIAMHRERQGSPDSLTSATSFADIPASGQSATGESRGLHNIASSSDEMLSLFELATNLAGHQSLSEAGEVITKHLRRLVSASLYVFYVNDITTNELEAKLAIGDNDSIVRGMRIPLGQRLSGWVAANRQTILNSDPTLDLGDAARTHGSRLRSCLSTAIVLDEDLVGVLSLYSTSPDAFSDNHRRIIEAVARQIAPTIRAAMDPEKRRAATNSNVDTGDTSFKSSVDPDATLILINLDLSQLPRDQDASAVEHVARETLTVIQVALDPSDLIFRNGSEEFLVRLANIESRSPRATAEKLSDTIHQHVRTRDGHGVKVKTAVIPSNMGNESLGDRVRKLRPQAVRGSAAAGSVVH
jgi:putative nucleotidyltransferase with HDIG domain